jgi:hypothetical protein
MWRGSSCLRSERLPAGNKQGDLRVPFFLLSACLLDPITLEALSTHPDPLGRAIDQNAHSLQIGIPAPFRPIIGVADVVAGNRPFSAHGANPCHKFHPWYLVERGKASKPNDGGLMRQPCRGPACA